MPTTIGIDLGGTKCLGVALAPDGTVAAVHRVASRGGNDGVIAVLTEVALALLDASPDAAAVGVGVPGLVDASGVLRLAPNLPGVRDLDIGSEVSARVALPVTVENDATAACWGERELGAARRADDCVFVALGTGIGGGIVANGRLYRGANGYAGEFGHMIVDPDGVECPCGQRGCWERYASGSGLGHLAREAVAAGDAPGVLERAGGGPEEVRGEHVTAAAAAGDPGAQLVMARFARWIGLGLANLANVLDPSVVVLGGGLVEAGAALLDPVRAAVAELSLGAHERRGFDVVAATLGERAGAVGSALLARRLESARR